mmetsp:Transcript_20353/g.61319  ORF Transcript_20353/g.61319 Transcript_20353/m.61319 type:complete len:366 (+) Transcript_20353:1153-2250(+)
MLRGICSKVHVAVFVATVAAYMHVPATAAAVSPLREVGECRYCRDRRAMVLQRRQRDGLWDGYLPDRRLRLVRSGGGAGGGLRQGGRKLAAAAPAASTHAALIAAHATVVAAAVGLCGGVRSTGGGGQVAARVGPPWSRCIRWRHCGGRGGGHVQRPPAQELDGPRDALLFAESHRHVGSSADAPSVGAAAVGRGVGDAHHRGACAAEAAAAAALPAAAATVAAALASGAPLEGGLGVGWGGARLRHLGARRQLPAGAGEVGHGGAAGGATGAFHGGPPHAQQPVRLGPHQAPPVPAAILRQRLHRGAGLRQEGSLPLPLHGPPPVRAAAAPFRHRDGPAALPRVSHRWAGGVGAGALPAKLPTH